MTLLFHDPVSYDTRRNVPESHDAVTIAYLEQDVSYREAPEVQRFR